MGQTLPCRSGPHCSQTHLWPHGNSAMISSAVSEVASQKRKVDDDMTSMHEMSALFTHASSFSPASRQITHSVLDASSISSANTSCNRVRTSDILGLSLGTLFQQLCMMSYIFSGHLAGPGSRSPAHTAHATSLSSWMSWYGINPSDQISYFKTPLISHSSKHNSSGNTFDAHRIPMPSISRDWQRSYHRWKFERPRMIHRCSPSEQEVPGHSQSLSQGDASNCADRRRRPEHSSMRDHGAVMLCRCRCSMPSATCMQTCINTRLLTSISFSTALMST